MNFILSGSYTNAFRQSLDWTDGHLGNVWYDDVGYFMETLRDLVYSSTQFDAIAMSDIVTGKQIGRAHV